MADRWVDRPPAPCHKTRRDEPQQGMPYLVEDVFVLPVTLTADGPQVTSKRPVPLVHAASQIERVCDLPGSPFKIMRRDKYESWNRTLVEAQMALEEAQARIAEQEYELQALRRNQGSIDVEALTNNVVARLEDRLPKKPGPKPKRPAAA